MLKHLQKLFAGQPAPTAQADNVEEVNMENEAGADTVASGTVDVASLTASLQEATTALATANAQIAELTALVNQAATFKAEAEKAAQATKLAARKEKAVLTVGTEKADKLMTATAGMEDEQFNTVLSVMASTMSTEETSDLFTEKGVEGNADTSAVQTNKTLELLQAKYCKTSATK